MTRIPALAIVAALCGCTGAPPLFHGAWSGTLTVAISCSDNSASTMAQPASWVIDEGQSTAQIAMGLWCDPVTVETSQDSASIISKACGSAIRGGEVVQQYLTSGVLDADGTILDVDLLFTDYWPNGDTCASHLTGALGR
jgi:hypothetical protein